MERELEPGSEILVLVSRRVPAQWEKATVRKLSPQRKSIYYTTEANRESYTRVGAYQSTWIWPGDPDPHTPADIEHGGGPRTDYTLGRYNYPLSNRAFHELGIGGTGCAFRGSLMCHECPLSWNIPVECGWKCWTCGHRDTCPCGTSGQELVVGWKMAERIADGEVGWKAREILMEAADRGVQWDKKGPFGCMKCRDTGLVNGGWCKCVRGTLVRGVFSMSSGVNGEVHERLREEFNRCRAEMMRVRRESFPISETQVIWKVDGRHIGTLVDHFKRRILLNVPIRIVDQWGGDRGARMAVLSLLCGRPLKSTKDMYHFELMGWHSWAVNHDEETDTWSLHEGPEEVMKALIWDPSFRTLVEAEPKMEPVA